MEKAEKELLRVPMLNVVPPDFAESAKSSGLKRILTADVPTKKLINRIIFRVWRILGGATKQYPFPIKGVFLFNAEECTGDFDGCDGMCMNQARTITADKRAMIGISTQAAARGEDYVSLVLLHEVSHAATGEGHTTQFHQYLDYLIMTYNAKYGTEIANDYSGGFTDEESSPTR